MSSLMQSALVEHTLQELLSCSKPIMVAYLPYHFAGMAEAFQTLRLLREHHIRVRLLLDPTIFHYYSKTEIVKQTENDDWIGLQTAESMKEWQELFLPVLSLSFATGISNLNDQDPIIRLVLQSLLSGKKVSALSNGLNPSQFSKATPFLKNLLTTNLQKITSYGIKVIDAKDAIGYFTNTTNTKKQVITGNDLEQLVLQNKTELVIDQQTIITPLALDILKHHQINLIRK